MELDLELSVMGVELEEAAVAAVLEKLDALPQVRYAKVLSF